MKNNIKSLAFALILMSLIAVAPFVVKAENGGDDVSGGTDSTIINGGDDAGSIHTDLTNGDDDTASVTGGTIINGGDDTGSVHTNLTNGDDDTGGTQAPGNESDPVNPPSNSGNGSGPVGSSGSSVGTSGGRATTLPTLGSFGQCEYITAYMKLGGNNSVAEVTKLQSFLSSQGIAVAATGIFDVETETAVKAFQAKYLDEVMLPWGVTTPSGQVYFTTKKKINEVYCKANFALTAEQIAQIEAYKNAVANGTLNASSTDAETVTGTSSIPLNPEVGSSDNSNQTGAVANTSFFGKVWKFIKGIFGR